MEQELYVVLVELHVMVAEPSISIMQHVKSNPVLSSTIQPIMVGRYSDTESLQHSKSSIVLFPGIRLQFSVWRRLEREVRFTLLMEVCPK